MITFSTKLKQVLLATTPKRFLLQVVSWLMLVTLPLHAVCVFHVTINQSTVTDGNKRFSEPFMRNIYFIQIIFLKYSSKICTKVMYFFHFCSTVIYETKSRLVFYSKKVNNNNAHTGKTQRTKINEIISIKQFHAIAIQTSS